LSPARIRKMEKDGAANTFAENGMDIVPGKIFEDLGDIFFENCDAAKADGIIKNKLINQPSQKK
jgi:hypothetical protein